MGPEALVRFASILKFHWNVFSCPDLAFVGCCKETHPRFHRSCKACFGCVILLYQESCLSFEGCGWFHDLMCVCWLYILCNYAPPVQLYHQQMHIELSRCQLVMALEPRGVSFQSFNDTCGATPLLCERHVRPEQMPRRSRPRQRTLQNMNPRNFQHL